jgi:hypothetical protein
VSSVVYVKRALARRFSGVSMSYKTDHRSRTRAIVVYGAIVCIEAALGFFVRTGVIRAFGSVHISRERSARATRQIGRSSRGHRCVSHALLYHRPIPQLSDAKLWDRRGRVAKPDPFGQRIGAQISETGGL